MVGIEDWGHGEGAGARPPKVLEGKEFYVNPKSNEEPSGCSEKSVCLCVCTPMCVCLHMYV